eukprot:CAMPEP_0114586108 /NCGR_PEP_ID=MMETSP0125-20121206/9430_1 /TAXON_ID=485358 ORGANISM="Aristerostoma sp., Strain ATCC 50986" /NCGR_SAMPLE_ID=MMETSP0125 /ASSEMBLY_ACC=CAM_ASM_000245 /LENGTH=344 /DNA_ID=CAMNT_0001781413 /DNA_START=38 /DNA_END=1072 /DNA_ORIENTATION=-
MIKTVLFLALALTAYTQKISISHLQGVPTEVEMRGLFEQYLQIMPSYAEPRPDRYEIFRQSALDAILHNLNPDRTWTAAINEFTGLTMEELTGRALMESQNCSATTPSKPLENTLDPKALPTVFDWRLLGVVSPVKNQGNCGSCWTFSTTGAVESHWAIYKINAPRNLSEMQLVDCAQDFNNNGCDGGLPSQAFEYIKYNNGIDLESAYPYHPKQNPTCNFTKENIGAYVPQGSFNISAGDEASIATYLVSNGPVSIAFEVTKDFMSYDSGVYVGKTCKSDAQSVNHAVLVVGYGIDRESNKNYWIVKNSWGATWGQDGYFFIERGSNMCGLAECASWPIVKGN